jgi:diguanylate cyclase (GGDEF)-like protein/PAS domain S-box-containing protein
MTEEEEKLAELLAVVLDAMEEGIAVLDDESRVLFWNPAAAAMTGYRGADLLARPLPGDFYTMDRHHHGAQESTRSVTLIDETGDEAGQTVGWTDRPALVHLRHCEGHVLPAMLRRTPLRNALGRRIGTLLRFHPVETVDTLPHGDMDEDDGQHVEHSQADMEDRLDEAWQEWTTGQVPLGLLWITVDQAVTMRKTHGRDASEAMLAIVERTLLHALRPTEILGRWGSNEFLVLCHERTPEMLMLHARHVGGIARTSDFRWWGDRVSLTVSVGAAQARQDEKLADLLKRAQKAMQASQTAGGNEVVLQEKSLSGNGGFECSQL